MKVGDVVRRKNRPFDSEWTGLLVKLDEDGFVWIQWFDDGTTDDCSSTLLEVVSEG